MKTLLRLGGCLLGVFLLSHGVQAQTAPLSTLEDVLAAIRAANGGEENIAKIVSIYGSGTVSQGETTRDISIVRKRPGLKRITVTTPQGTVHRGFDGTRSWTLAVPKYGERQVVEMTGEEKVEFESEPYILDALLAPPELGLQHRLEGVEYIGRVPCYVVETLLPNVRRLAYVDSRTLRFLRFVEHPREGDGPPATIEASDYTKVHNVWFARKVVREKEGVPTVTVQLDSIEVNTGIFDAVFAFPTVD